MTRKEIPLTKIYRLVRSLFCTHQKERTFVRNIHGDEIIHRGYKRSVWRCNHCGATCLDDNFHPVEHRDTPSQMA